MYSFLQGRRHGRLGADHGRRQAAVEHAGHDLGGLAADRYEVVVRVGLDADQQIGLLDHQRGDVGVAVQGGHEHDLVADRLADGGQQIALTVVKVLGRARAVELNEDAVDRPGLAQLREKTVFGPLVGVAGGFAADPRKHELERHGIPLPLPGALQKAVDGAIPAARIEQGIAGNDRLLKQLQPHPLLDKSIDRNQVAADCNAHDRILPVSCSLGVLYHRPGPAGKRRTWKSASISRTTAGNPSQEQRGGMQHGRL